MNEDMLNDLKQFIATTVSQATASMATKEDITALRADIAKLEKKVDDGFIGVGETIEQINDLQTELDQSLIRLEQQTT